MVKHWILVGDAGGAKVYETDALMEELQLVDDIGFAHDHVRDSATHSNRALPGAGSGAAASGHDPHKLAEEKFARAVAKSINDANSRHRFDRLVVVAPPRFLGEFRAELSHNTAGRVVASFHHDWTRLSLRDLSAQIRKNMPDLAGMP
jgi:protein required for attachment to host cells